MVSTIERLGISICRHSNLSFLLLKHFIGDETIQ